VAGVERVRWFGVPDVQVLGCTHPSAANASS
jgi:hypothetical protein